MYPPIQAKVQAEIKNRKFLYLYLCPLPDLLNSCFFLQCFSLVCQFPGEIRVGLPKVAVCRRLFEDRPPNRR